MPTLSGKPWGVLPPHLGKITEHFTFLESVCRCGCGRLASVEATVKTAHWLEVIRTRFGVRPVVISSWTRCPWHNRRVGGATKSEHMKSRAVDFNVKGLPPQQVQTELREARDVLRIGGLGRYHSWTHVDRGPKRDWEGP
jgi:uncharacterized protein YcbK (DUF882 family)